jgi:pyridoxine 5-phosphate synthase
MHSRTHKTALSVNLNKVALLRNQRDLEIPDVVRSGVLCLDAGAHGLTLHPRPDRRHALPRDCFALGELILARRRERPGIELNIEGNPLPEFLELVSSVKPDQCTLVPDAPDARTSSEGWNVEREGEQLRAIVQSLHALGIRVSLFMEPDIAQIDRVPQTGADRIELYTEPYSRAFGTPDEARLTAQYAATARRAQQLGLGVNAGHDLNLANLGHFCSNVPDVLEVSIGHAITADALEMGWAPQSRPTSLRSKGRADDRRDRHRPDRDRPHRPRMGASRERLCAHILSPRRNGRNQGSPRHATLAREALGGEGSIRQGRRDRHARADQVVGITVVHDAMGRPDLKFAPFIQAWLHRRGIDRCYISISDERDLVCAFVVLEHAETHNVRR